MNDTEIRIAIAEACGQKWESHAAEWHGEKSAQWLIPQYWTCNGQQRPMLEAPDYPNDFNAMHEAIKTLNKRQLYRFSYELCALTGFNFIDFDANSNSDLTYLICASARQWAEAFLRTIGKWVVL